MIETGRNLGLSTSKFTEVLDLDSYSSVKNHHLSQQQPDLSGGKSHSDHIANNMNSDHQPTSMHEPTPNESTSPRKRSFRSIFQRSKSTGGMPDAAAKPKLSRFSSFSSYFKRSPKNETPLAQNLMFDATSAKKPGFQQGGSDKLHDTTNPPLPGHPNSADHAMDIENDVSKYDRKSPYGGNSPYGDPSKFSHGTGAEDLKATAYSDTKHHDATVPLQMQPPMSTYGGGSSDYFSTQHHDETKTVDMKKEHTPPRNSPAQGKLDRQDSGYGAPAPSSPPDSVGARLNGPWDSGIHIPQHDSYKQVDSKVGSPAASPHERDPDAFGGYMSPLPVSPTKTEHTDYRLTDPDAFNG
jgi:hypothetical protein